MCKRDKDNAKLGEKKGFEKGKKIGVEEAIRRCIEAHCPAEQICIVGDITREQLKAQYNY